MSSLHPKFLKWPGRLINKGLPGLLKIWGWRFFKTGMLDRAGLRAVRTAVYRRIGGLELSIVARISPG